MLLTQERYERIAMAARGDLRDVLKLIADHEEKLAQDKKAAYLNPYIVLGSVVAWERFTLDLVAAATFRDWEFPGDAGKVTPAQEHQICWPGRDGQYEKSTGAHRIDKELQQAGVMDGPLTHHWACWVASSWRGKMPTRWQYVNYSAQPAEDHAELLQDAMASAKSARDAVAHGLFRKKAKVAEDRGHYWWYGDNHAKGGAPTIQNGYARGVAALFVQLVDASLGAIGACRGWGNGNRLPDDWFAAERVAGTFAGVDLWAGTGLR